MKNSMNPIKLPSDQTPSQIGLYPNNQTQQVLPNLENRDIIPWLITVLILSSENGKVVFLMIHEEHSEN